MFIATLSKDLTRNIVSKGSKKIPYLRTENLENHTLFFGMYLYRPYTGAYKNASSCDTPRQILSIMTCTASLAAIREFIPGLTQFRYTVANLHRLQHGTGASVPRQPTARFRVDEVQLDHFLQFITSPHIVQDLPFGQKSLQLSNGNVVEVPNVIRALIPERITTQYK